MRGALLIALALTACGGPTKPAGAPVGGGSAAGSGGGSAMAPIADAAEHDECTSDEDCTLVDACCGCNAGGRKVGLRVDAVKAYEASRAQRCGQQMCAMHISTHPSCNAEPVCKKGHCRAQAHMNQGEPTVPPAGPQ